MFQQNIIELFSSKRLSKYESFDEYLENIKISQRYYPQLHLIEISLRNKINNILTQNLGVNWIIENINYIPQDQRSKLKSELLHDDMLANLTFGTWIHILNKYYRLFSDADLSYILGLSRKQINSQFNKLCNELKIIKNYRNRVFHYEKINNHHQYHNIEHLIDKFIRLLDIDNVLEEAVRKLKAN